MAVVQPNARRPFVPAADFAAGLDRAGRAVLRVLADGQGKCTGWLITDTLAVVPEYALEGGVTYRCQFGTDPTLIDAAPVTPPPGVRPTPIRPALLRLAHQAPGQPLPLPADQPPDLGPVFVLQHPEGRPDLHLSAGVLVGADGGWVRYTANTLPGSSGSPVFDLNWVLIGVHMQAKSGHNEGMPVAAVLAALRGTPVWSEVAKAHGLANVSGALAALDRLTATVAVSFRVSGGAAPLVRAAVLWKFDPNHFFGNDRDWLESRVVDPDDELWMLVGEDRAKLLREADSPAALRQARGGDLPDKHPGQATIDRILKGPPFVLAKLPTDDLPYWLQAVRWFDGVVPDLPAPAAVHRELDRRRTTGRLDRLVGPVFRGRAAELKRLRAWDRANPGPLVVYGVGGVGKSALVAKFADAALTAGRVVLWLDFDRADLAPDDAVSVLAHLNQQAGVLLDGFVPAVVAGDDWLPAAGTFGTELTRLTPDKPPLLVLDGFEVAQHVRRYAEELWPLLDAVLTTAPAMRVLVAGRAPVPVLRLAGRPAETLEVTGMTRADAAAWLRDGGIPDGPVQDQVLAISNQMPLILKLAIKLKNRGVKPADLPAALRRELVEEYLIRRVLDRVIDPSLRELARGVLVLRRLTAALLGGVFGDLLPVPGPDVDQVHDRLAAELALVENDPSAAGPALRVRPEVRTATLHLLDLQDAGWVRAIDRRAADWYATQNPDDPATAAERVYHLLRLGDTAAAGAAWRLGCGRLLDSAEAELPTASGTRAWLRKKLHDDEAVGVGLAEWEAEAVERVREALKRGHYRTVPQILSVRTERTPDSPLVVYNAYQRWRVGDLAGGRELLGSEPDIGGFVGRDRAVVAAWLAGTARDLPAADRHLTAVGSGPFGGVLIV